MGRRSTRLSGSLGQSAMASPSSGEVERQARGLLNHSPNPDSRKKAKTSEMSITPRRSARLRSPVVTDQDAEIERVIQQITIPSTDHEDEPFTGDDVGEGDEQLGNENGECEGLGNISVESEPLEHITRGKTIEKKLDYLLERLESKQGEKVSVSKTPVPVDARYRRLYIDAQKMIESLKEEKRQLSLASEKLVKNLEEENRQHSLNLNKMVESLKEENRQLSLELQYMRGKLDAYDKAYEKGNSFCSDVLVKVKDVISAFHAGDTSHKTSPPSRSTFKENETPLQTNNASASRKRPRRRRY